MRTPNGDGKETALRTLLELAERRAEVRATVHSAVLVLFDAAPRVLTSYLEMVRRSVGSIEPAEFAELTERGLDLLGDGDLVSSYFRGAPQVLEHRGMEYVRIWHEQTDWLREEDPRVARVFLEALVRSCDEVGADQVPLLADVGLRIAERSRYAVRAFFASLPDLLGNRGVQDVVGWAEEGLKLAEEEGEVLLYLSYGPDRRGEAAQVLSRETSFSLLRTRVARLLEAFRGEPVRIRDMRTLIDGNELPAGAPAVTDGENLYIRPSLPTSQSGPLPLYRLVALHAAAHGRFGTFDAETGRRLQDRLLRRDEEQGSGRSKELERFLIGLAEDFRVDEAMFRTLPGLRKDAEEVLGATYGHLFVRQGGGLLLAPESLRAHLTCVHFGLRLLSAGDEVVQGVEAKLAPLLSPLSGPDDSLRVGRELHGILAPLWIGAVRGGDGSWSGLQPPEVPYPPYHDHLLLGLSLAGGSHSRDSSAEPEDPAGDESGRILEIPAGFHPGENVVRLQSSASGPPEKGDLEQSVEVLEETDASDAEGEVFPGEVRLYDEWDHEWGEYRPDWCTVRCRPGEDEDGEFVEKTLVEYGGEMHLVTRQFEKLKPEALRRRFRSREGEELDMEALVEALSDARAGAPMDDAVFVRREKDDRDVAALLLLDTSESTAQALDDGRRVIDVEKQGVLLMAEALDRLGDGFGVLGFASEGRRAVDAYTLKAFAEDYGIGAARRIGGASPGRFTRLGAAIRHGSALLGEQPAKVKLLLLLSDGRPYDLGYGDMRYAMEDTKAALSEARRSGLDAFCITVDPEGPEYLEEIFGPGNYTVIQDVAALPGRLPRIYRNLTV